MMDHFEFKKGFIVSFSSLDGYSITVFIFSKDSDSQNPPSLAAHPKPSQAPVTEHRRSCRRVLRRSISDPVLLDLAAKGNAGSAFCIHYI